MREGKEGEVKGKEVWICMSWEGWRAGWIDGGDQDMIWRGEEKSLRVSLLV